MVVVLVVYHMEQWLYITHCDNNNLIHETYTTKNSNMETLIGTAVNYAGELIIAGVALLVRSIEKKMIIRRKLKEWESGK